MCNISYEEMLQLCNQKEEFRAKTEVVNGIEVTIFSYMVAMRDTFDSKLAREFRGTTFRNDTKECICRPFPKFFNIGEREETSLENIDIIGARYYIKHDGSMATPVLLNNRIIWKTKNSFYSDVANKINNYWVNHKNHDTRKAMRKMLAGYNYTPIYEYVAPHNRIVLEYQEEELLYLGFRDNNTGEYIPNFHNREDIKYHEIFAMEDVEGFVIELQSGELVKAKTQWYLDRHKICTEFNPKKIIECTLNDTIDDMIAVIYQLGLPERAVNVEKLRDETHKMKIETLRQVKLAWDTVGFIADQKEFALKVQSTLQKQWWPFIFAMRGNKDTTKILNKYVFDTVYNNTKQD